MTVMRMLKAAAVFALLGLAPNAVSAAQTSILFILDSSGSMAGQVGGTPKMATAKRSLAQLLSDLPKDVKVGVMVYGHRKKKSCTDVEVAIPVGQANTKTLRAVLRRVAPKGKTPIGYSLKLSAGAFAGLENGNNNVVLISDGIETCGGDPCKTAAALAKSNVNVRIHVVGFDISKKDRKQLECIARAGGGKYFPAKSTKEFTKAVTKAAELAQAPVPKVYFFDDFKGEVLGEHWEVLKPDPNAYIVENGKVTIIATGTPAGPGNIPNFLRLNKPFPRGDWKATIKFRPEFNTAKEWVYFGMYNDQKNWLLARVTAFYRGLDKCWIRVFAVKVANGKSVHFERRIEETCGGPRDAIKLVQKWQPFLLRLTKKGRAYTVSIRFDGTKKPKWIEVPSLISLRAKGGLAFGITMGAKVSGQGLLDVDWVKIETME